MNPTVQSIKRYHVARVYRRDQPAIRKGRLRDFYQCDIDFAGVYDPLLPDAEILRIVTEIFDALGFQEQYAIKINHRKILDGLFAVSGVPQVSHCLSQKKLEETLAELAKLTASPA